MRNKKSYFEYQESNKATGAIDKYLEQTFWRFEYTTRRFIKDRYEFLKCNAGLPEDFEDRDMVSVVQKDVAGIILTVFEKNKEGIDGVVEGYRDAARKYVVTEETNFETALFRLTKYKKIEELREAVFVETLRAAVAAFHKRKFGLNPKYSYKIPLDLLVKHNCERGKSLRLSDGGEELFYYPVIENGTESNYMSALSFLHTVSVEYGYFPWAMLNPLPVEGAYGLQQGDNLSSYIDSISAETFLKINSRQVDFIDANFKGHDEIQYFEAHVAGFFYCYFSSLSECFNLKSEVKSALAAYQNYRKRPKQNCFYGEIDSADIQIVIEKNPSIKNSAKLPPLVRNTITDSIVSYQRWHSPHKYLLTNESIETVRAFTSGREQRAFLSRCLGLWMWDKVTFEKWSLGRTMNEYLNIYENDKADVSIFEFRRGVDSKQLKRDFNSAVMGIANVKIG
ncbi:hypothetical protein [Halodesulfovibrio marinisediminis]|uniref:Uncharacterized protein n=1 Tax=Halodesulfovibrio marinisediminis DSM 17456 TaxID=1121457 RepID=A0A1N6IFW1_9BACT|nr:hypothetical protein [Halodesulfovibrio marinisediminis]SIO30903.1 hypothetical protein SAMN02745161_2711 [Halodesulfovibrio marinisediminis DSM 17456]